MKWLKHAFAVDPPGPAEPTPAQHDAVEKVCREVVRRQLSTPAWLFLEMSRPLNYIGSQTLHFFQPMIGALTDSAAPKHFAEFLEHRGSIEYICRRIEDLEAEASDKGESSNEEGE
ncbi:MAG: hypothetical protein ACE5KM_12810 [Planctomycetaceae bacterium]